MTSDKDPTLQTLFDNARAELIENGFTGHVMSEVERSRRRTMAIWVGASLLGVLFLWWLMGPVLGVVEIVTGLLPTSLFDLGESWIAKIVAPINSVSAAVAAVGFGLYAGYRKIFS